ncbi:hypothetical protein [Sphingomonas soli]|uniref:hypothetical protein n=1 Tax=Sphingomonas soli TaxID=266127 RepID=UPI00082AB74D|nr:hypothetical protein [Sphingomonas soli]
MLLSVLALALAAPPCTLPRELAGWSRTGQGLDTRHATTRAPRGGRVETQVTIRKAGTFGIAINGDGWIDVAPERGKPLRMVAENRGPRCSGISKIVRYRLQPGTYRVTISKLGERRARVMLVHGARPDGFARRRRSG